VDVLVDNGGPNPDHNRLAANIQVSSGDWDTLRAVESLTFSFEAAGKVATAFIFSYAFHNPVINQDVCHYQGHVIVKGA